MHRHEEKKSCVYVANDYQQIKENVIILFAIGFCQNPERQKEDFLYNEIISFVFTVLVHRMNQYRFVELYY